jgi:hypothetical protein
MKNPSTFRSHEPIIPEDRIHSVLAAHSAPGRARVADVLAKAREAAGLSPEDVACLASIKDPEGLRGLFDAARTVKETIYGRRLVLFAPLYVSNVCANECAYCAFRGPTRGVPAPPSLLTSAAAARSDDELYRIITNGRRTMPSYAAQIPVDDRWAIVLYLRALQRSQRASIDDVPEELKTQLR